MSMTKLARAKAALAPRQGYYRVKPEGDEWWDRSARVVKANSSAGAALAWLRLCRKETDWVVGARLRLVVLGHGQVETTWKVEVKVAFELDPVGDY